MTRLLARPGVAGLLLLVVVSSAGCRPEPPPAAAPLPFATVGYQDIVVDQALYGSFDPATGVHTCADESRDSFVLAAGESRSYTVTLTGPSEMLLGGCVEGALPGDAADLALAVEARAGNTQEERVALAEGAPGTSGSGWRMRRIALAGLPVGRELRFELSAALPPGARAFVDTFAVRSALATAAAPAARRTILISLDAFREDAIGAIGGGGGRTVTPELDRLLAESERFSPSWSEEISTKTSHASMLTGLPVDLHGVDREERPLAPEISTLAERLRAAGAATGAFMQIAPFFAEKFALNQGFDTYRLKAWTVPQELRLAAEWAGAHRQGSSFLFVHLYGAHSDFGILPYEANGVTRATVAEKFGVADYGCAGEVCASRRLLAINYRALEALPREKEITRWLYDRGVETLDRQLGVFFAELRRAGLWDDTLIVLTGDHGEAFGEHGYFLHTTPHEETLRVPLLVKWPRSAARAGVTTSRFSTALDIAPTILGYFGLPADDLPGHDLEKPPERGARLMLSKDAVRVDDLKLVLATPEFPRALYDLAADPGEQTNLLPGRAVDASRLEEIRRLALAAASRRMGVAANGAVEAQPFTPEEREQLRSLGYL
ncbi:MAG: sulfatase [Thermoanaerobaculia bacterium]